MLSLGAPFKAKSPTLGDGDFRNNLAIIPSYYIRSLLLLSLSSHTFLWTIMAHSREGRSHAWTPVLLLLMYEGNCTGVKYPECAGGPSIFITAPHSSQASTHTWKKKSNYCLSGCKSHLWSDHFLGRVNIVTVLMEVWADSVVVSEIAHWLTVRQCHFFPNVLCQIVCY